MDSPCPQPKKQMNGSITALQEYAHDFACQQTTQEEAHRSYLELADTYDYNTLVIGRMVTG
jgi:hypothetical protein